MPLESSPMFTHAIVKPDAYNRDIGRMSSVCTSTKSCNSNHNRPLSNLSSMWVSGDYDLLPDIPMLYPIERSSTIVDCDDPRQLAQRITDCLQKLSITAKCNNASEVRYQYICSYPFCVYVSSYNISCLTLFVRLHQIIVIGISLCRDLGLYKVLHSIIQEDLYQQ